ncbi:MAG TPA: TIGR03790 family protein [Candidatus Paceibacterota bacterium]|nr:TIGR03790 family protein [Verrucomicrobiota bacterium]HSA09997.1 TIGR03790 family protein [Candidatus Paceibacterota bacterium]
MKGLLPALTILASAAAHNLCAASPGDEVIVVYNTQVPDSKGVAEYYADRRHVPASQVFGFPLSTNENMSRREFHEVLAQPLAQALKKQKLWEIGPVIIQATTNHPGRVEWRAVTSKIRYAVLCYGVPLRVEHDATFKEAGVESLRPELRRDEAALDSELALLPLIEEKPPLAGPLRNSIYTTTNGAMLHPTNGVLLVARLDGPTPDIARGLVDKALQAERDGLWGRAYCDARNTTDPGYKVGDDWIRGAADICRRLGFETVVDENPGTFPASFPMSQIAYYLGWYDGSVSGPFAQRTVEFMPGAFAYHIHSYSAATLRSASQHWVGPLLAKGTTITMGCVNEPYLTGTPDLGVFTARLIYSRFSFGEAAYACQPVLSWQTTVVGDPLYRPYGMDPDRLHRALHERDSKLIEWSWLRLANLHLAAGKPRADVAGFLEQVVAVKRGAVLMEKLGDLYAAQGKPSSAIHACRQALELAPSPQQRVRLLLTLGERLLASDQTQEAYEAYQKLLQEFPDYADKLGLYRKLLPLAQKLDRKADAEKHQAEITRLSPPPPKPPPDNTGGKP